MSRLIDRHAVHIGFEVGAVIEVVAAHQVLIGLALTAVQGHDQSGDRLEHLTGTVLRQELQLLVIDHAFARGCSRPEELEPPGRDGDLLQRPRLGTVHAIRVEGLICFGGRARNAQQKSHCGRSASA